MSLTVFNELCFDILHKKSMTKLKEQSMDIYKIKHFFFIRIDLFHFIDTSLTIIRHTLLYNFIDSGGCLRICSNQSRFKGFHFFHTF